MTPTYSVSVSRLRCSIENDAKSFCTKNTSKETFRSDRGALHAESDCVTYHLSALTAHTAPRMLMSVHDVSNSPSEQWYN